MLNVFAGGGLTHLTHIAHDPLYLRSVGDEGRCVGVFNVDELSGLRGGEGG